MYLGSWLLQQYTSSKVTLWLTRSKAEILKDKIVFLCAIKRSVPCRQLKKRE